MEKKNYCDDKIAHIVRYEYSESQSAKSYCDAKIAYICRL